MSWLGKAWNGIKEAGQDFISDPASAVMFPVGVTKVAINAANGDYTDGVNKHDQPAATSASPQQGQPSTNFAPQGGFWGGGQPEWQGSSAIMGAPHGNFIQGMAAHPGFDDSTIRTRQWTAAQPQQAQSGGWVYQPGRGPVWTPGNRA